MTTSALSGVIDYLLTQFTTAVNTVDTNGIVSEGFVVTAPPPPAPIIVVGMPHPDDALVANETRQYVTLGAGHVEETFTIPCYIDVFVVGINEQATARKKACLIFDKIVDVVRADLTLGGNLTRGRYASISDISMIGTRDEDEATHGRRSVLSFNIHANNLY